MLLFLCSFSPQQSGGVPLRRAIAGRVASASCRARLGGVHHGPTARAQQLSGPAFAGRVSFAPSRQQLSSQRRRRHDVAISSAVRASAPSPPSPSSSDTAAAPGATDPSTLKTSAGEIPPAMPLVTILEPETNRTLLCMLRRRFKLNGDEGEERCLCLPLDHPIDVLRGEGLDENEDLSDIGDEELLQIIPDMALALATKGMLLQRSAFCMTVRGAVRFNEEDTLLMDTGMDEESEVGVVVGREGGTRRHVHLVRTQHSTCRRDELFCQPNGSGSRAAAVKIDTIYLSQVGSSPGHEQ